MFCKTLQKKQSHYILQFGALVLCCQNPVKLTEALNIIIEKCPIDGTSEHHVTSVYFR